MKNLIAILLLLFISACASNNSKVEENKGIKDSVKTETIVETIKTASPEIEKISDSTTKAPFYAINITAYSNIDSAIIKVKELREKYKNINYLWMPDYKSISNKELYLVFMGPIKSLEKCIDSLKIYKKENPAAYAVVVNHIETRTVFHSPLDIRVNNKFQNQILIYSTPEDEQAYAESGGEDWGWFTNDVSEYFGKVYNGKVMVSSIGYSVLSESDIAKLKKELNLEGFGYILVKKGGRTFIPHSPPDEIISSACEFFGYEVPDDWRSEMAGEEGE